MGSKTCTKCDAEKPREEFSIKRDSRDGLRNQCKACENSRSRQIYESKKQKYKDWYQANADRLRDEYLENAEKRREYQRGYRGNRHKTNPERIAQLSREYNTRHKGRANARTAKRYATKTQATPIWASAKKIAAIYEESSRLTRETGIPHHVDHIVPLRSRLVCGLHWEFNLKVIPGSENRLKSNCHWPDMP